jgi:hypothetical protein
MTVHRITVAVVAVIGALLLLAFFAWLIVGGVGLFLEWRRLLKSTRPIGEPAPATSEPAPVVEPRSPFRRKRAAK